MADRIHAGPVRQALCRYCLGCLDAERGLQAVYSTSGERLKFPTALIEARRRKKGFNYLIITDLSTKEEPMRSVKKRDTINIVQVFRNLLPGDRVSLAH
jgi:hypothetical protein